MAYITKQERDSLEIRRLRAQNSKWLELHPKWEFYLASYEGGEDFANKANLFQHVREHEKDFHERTKRIYYDNHIEELVDFFTDFIFSETIQRDGGKDEQFYNEFIADVNKKGDDITKFMAEVCTDMQVYGMIYVLVDTPRMQPGQKFTREQAKRLGIRPYWILLRPDEITDWVTDAFDQYVYVKRCEPVTSLDTSGKVASLERYTEWYLDKIKVSEIDVSDPSKPVLLPSYEIPNALKEIPLVPVRFKRSKKDSVIGNSFLRDMASAAKEILNLTSLEQEFLYRQCFNILAMEAEESLPFKDQEEGESGTSNALIYPRGAKPPQYIAPSSEPADKIAKTMARVASSMLRRATQSLVNELFNGGKASGFSKAQSFSTTVPKIATRAETLERAEVRLMQLTMRCKNSVWTGTVKYKDHYEITNITDWLTQFSIMLHDLGMPSPTFALEEMKKAINLFDAKLTPETKAKVYQELEAKINDAWLSKVQADQVVEGRPANNAGGDSSSPAAQQKNKQTGTMAEVQKESVKNQGHSATKRLRGQ
jgi:hypothetical protein